MSDLLIVLGLCLVLILGGALPLLRKRPTDDELLPPAKETLRDWRSEK